MCLTENGDEGSSSSGGGRSVGMSQRCGDEATTVDTVKCALLLVNARNDNDSTTTAPLTASEHDHLVSSTIHSDGSFPLSFFSL